MVTGTEVARAVYGAWRLALLDRKGLDFFDGTVEAYWNSFYAAAIVAPAYALLLVLRLSEVETRAGPVAIMAVEALAYIIGWVAFPLIMIYVCDRLGRFDRYLRYIAAHNWSNVIQIAVFLLVTIFAKGFLGGGLAVFLGLSATVAILFYQWFIARTALEVSGGRAASIVGLDLLISILINLMSNRYL
ncbi:MAG: hypothetical protein OXI64_13580 [Defluviicoccus sp.]|nr:hypothetical protein [Defluviicoccus sp.]